MRDCKLLVRLRLGLFGRRDSSNTASEIARKMRATGTRSWVNYLGVGSDGGRGDPQRRCLGEKQGRNSQRLITNPLIITVSIEVFIVWTIAVPTVVLVAVASQNGRLDVEIASNSTSSSTSESLDFGGRRHTMIKSRLVQDDSSGGGGDVVDRTNDGRRNTNFTRRHPLAGGGTGGKQRSERLTVPKVSRSTLVGLVVVQVATASTSAAATAVKASLAVVVNEEG